MLRKSRHDSGSPAPAPARPFGIAILAAVFTAAGSYASGRAFGAGFVPVAFVAAGLSVAGALAGVAIPGRRPVRPGAVPLGTHGQPQPTFVRQS